MLHNRLERKHPACNERSLFARKSVTNTINFIKQTTFFRAEGTLIATGTLALRSSLADFSFRAKYSKIKVNLKLEI